VWVERTQEHFPHIRLHGGALEDNPIAWICSWLNEYLSVAAEDTNPDVFIAALGDVAKARGMAQIAKDAGLPTFHLQLLSQDRWEHGDFCQWKQSFI
jgi:hypothetical protein